MLDLNDRMEKREIRKGYQYFRDLPVNYKSEDAFRFDSILLCSVSKAFSDRLNEVKVCQYYIFSGTRLIEDFCLPIQKRGKIQVWKQWLKLKIFPETKIQEAIWITDTWSKNYFHWILECLPRLFALRNQGVKSPLLIPEHIYNAHYVKESLSDLGIEVFPFNFKQTIKVDSLFVASHDSPCAFDPSYINGVILRFQELDLPEKKLANRRIYISRRDAFKRKVENELELLPLLTRFGFEVLQMEKLNFKEQRELMRETQVLMSIHGAGLANLIFMPEGSKVIELHPDVERYNSCFYHLAAAIGRYYFYSFEQSNHTNPQEANITVDLKKLETLLNSL